MRYLQILFDRASKRSVLLTDRLTILIAPFATFALWLNGAKMTDSIQEALFVGIAMAVMGVVGLRLLAATYFVWKDDQDEKSKLNAALKDPRRQAEIDMLQFATGLRKELSNSLGRLASFATQPISIIENQMITEKEVWQKVSDVDKIINQLSYDVAARIAAVHFRNACVQMLAGEKTEGQWFWQQRQITFRILHKNDRISDIMSLIELEIELERRGETSLGEGLIEDESPIYQIKELVKELGDDYYNPKLAEKLRQITRDTGI